MPYSFAVRTSSAVGRCVCVPVCSVIVSVCLAAMCYLLALAKRRYDNRRFRHKTPLLLNAEELEGESHIA